MELILITKNYPYGDGEEILEQKIKCLSEKFIRIHILCLSKDKILTRITPNNVFVTRIDNKDIENKVFSAFKMISSKTIKELDYVRYSLKLKTDKNILREIFSYYCYEKELLRKIMNLCAKDTVLCSLGLGAGAYAMGNFKFPCFKKIAVSDEKDTNYMPFRREIYKNSDVILFPDEKEKEDFIKNIKDENIINGAELEICDTESCLDEIFYK